MYRGQKNLKKKNSTFYLTWHKAKLVFKITWSLSLLSFHLKSYSANTAISNGTKLGRDDSWEISFRFVQIKLILPGDGQVGEHYIGIREPIVFGLIHVN